LRRFAGALETVLLALFYSSVAGQQTFLTQQRPELLIGFYQSSGYTMSYSLGLTGNAAAGNFSFDVKPTCGVRGLKGLLDMAPMFKARKIVLVRFAVNYNLSLAREQLHLRYGAFALAYATVVRLITHQI
jgi:hypothetical protein